MQYRDPKTHRRGNGEIVNKKCARDRTPPWDLHPILAPEPMRPIGAPHVSLPSQEDANPAIPIAGILGRQRRGIPHRQPRLVASRRPRYREHGARVRRPFFSRDLLEDVDLQIAVRHHLLQAAVLLLELA